MTQPVPKARPLPEVHLVLGTRPEAVKLAPLAQMMSARGRIRPVIIDTGQHPDMTPQALSSFSLSADVTLQVDRRSGGLSELVTQLLQRLDALLEQRRPSCVVVQGDTATTLAGALAGFWRGVPVVHVEAGLRSGDLTAPFPEEANRALVSRIASLHLAPTPSAAANLAAEGTPSGPVLVTGNTVIDAALTLAEGQGWASGQVAGFTRDVAASKGRLVLVTAHRRESWGRPLAEVLTAVADLVRLCPDVWIVFSTHANPAVRDQVEAALTGLPRTAVTPPLPYTDMVNLIRMATLVLSDSGGVQEEAPAFGTPTLVLRDVTERVEAIESGCARLVGTSYEPIMNTAMLLLLDERARAEMARRANPFGDGQASARCEQAIAWLLGLVAAPPDEFVPGVPAGTCGREVA